MLTYLEVLLVHLFFLALFLVPGHGKLLGTFIFDDWTKTHWILFIVLTAGQFFVGVFLMDKIGKAVSILTDLLDKYFQANKTIRVLSSIFLIVLSCIFWLISVPLLIILQRLNEPSKQSIAE